jgi:hypothetical protein
VQSDGSVGRLHAETHKRCTPAFSKASAKGWARKQAIRLTPQDLGGSGSRSLATWASDQLGRATAEILANGRHLFV